MVLDSSTRGYRSRCLPFSWMTPKGYAAYHHWNSSVCYCVPKMRKPARANRSGLAEVPYWGQKVFRINIASKNRIIQIGNIKTQANEMTINQKCSVTPWSICKPVVRKNRYTLIAPAPMKKTIAINWRFLPGSFATSIESVYWDWNRNEPAPVNQSGLLVPVLKAGARWTPSGGLESDLVCFNRWAYAARSSR